jgi:hypothetical protein
MEPETRQDKAELIRFAHDAIQRFLAGSKSPALLEPGEAQIRLTADSYDIALTGGRLTIQAWDRERTILRRITRVLADRPGELNLEIERFGGRTGTLKLLDTSRPRTQVATRRGQRLHYRESIRRSLARQYPGWKVADLSTEADLEHSLSPAYARALIQKGSTGIAAIGAGPDSLDPDGALTFGLIWFDYVKSRERKLRIDELAVFLPEGAERTTCLRTRYLNELGVLVSIFVCGEGCEQKVDGTASGNLDTQLATYTSQFSTTESVSDSAIRGILQNPGAEAIECGDGSLSLRIRGYEFARRKNGELWFGLETKHPATTSNFEEIEALARHLSAMRVPAGERRSPLFAAHAELWLESQVRRSLTTIDASLLGEPVYGQVPAFAGGDRGVIDLLACDAHGRLAVLELKASADVHLPLQALDYWMRVKWHAERGEFARHGYFTGIQLRMEAPRLLLVAPALDFHPSTETILKYFCPAIDVQRIGVGLNWRSDLQAAFRLSGAETRA